jgi:hypothetical protein
VCTRGIAIAAKIGALNLGNRHGRKEAHLSAFQRLKLSMGDSKKVVEDVAIPRSVLRPESFASHTSNSFFFAYEPKDMAAEITAIDFDLYSAINLKECLGQVWPLWERFRQSAMQYREYPIQHQYPESQLCLTHVLAVAPSYCAVGVAERWLSPVVALAHAHTSVRMAAGLGKERQEHARAERPCVYRAVQPAERLGTPRCGLRARLAPKCTAVTTRVRACVRCARAKGAVGVVARL